MSFHVSGRFCGFERVCGGVRGFSAGLKGCAEVSGVFCGSEGVCRGVRGFLWV